MQNRINHTSLHSGTFVRNDIYCTHICVLLCLYAYLCLYLYLYLYIYFNSYQLISLFLLFILYECLTFAVCVPLWELKFPVGLIVSVILDLAHASFGWDFPSVDVVLKKCLGWEFKNLYKLYQVLKTKRTYTYETPQRELHTVITVCCGQMWGIFTEPDALCGAGFFTILYLLYRISSLNS